MTSKRPDSKRRIVPRWRDSVDAALTGELRSERRRGVADPPRQATPHFDELVADWNERKALDVASDLISAAIAVGRGSAPAVLEAAKLVERSGPTDDIRQLATRLLSDRVGATPQAASIPFDYHIAYAQLRSQIAAAKLRVRNYPRNAIGWADLARLYVASGQHEKARVAMRVSTNLAPDSRFVLRAAARFSVHADGRDKAETIEEGLHILRRSRRLRSDAWLMAAEMSLATILGETPKTLTIARKISEADAIEPWDSAELNGALGTIAIEQGGVGKPSKFFSRSLRAPTENALAQAQWAANAHNAISVPSNSFHGAASVPHEALALRFRAERRWSDAVQSCRDWSVMEPTSTRPLILGTFIAEVALGDGEIAKEFAERARLTAPNEPWVLNNLAVALIYSGQIEAAETYMSRINLSSLQESAQAAVLATHGLLEYRKGNLIAGSELYLKAARCAAANEDPALRAMVLWHLLQEEARIGAPGGTAAGDLLWRKTYSVVAPELGALKERVLKSNSGPIKRSTSLVRSMLRRSDHVRGEENVISKIGELLEPKT